MKIIKPDTLSLLYRVFDWKGGHFLSAAVMAGFKLDETRDLVDEALVWDGAGLMLGEGQVLDLFMPKLRGEVLVLGKCFAPRGTEVRGAGVYLRVDHLEKHLEVFGDRFVGPGQGFGTRLIPHPFTEMDISWPNAFGGPDYPYNPVGKGLRPIVTKEGYQFTPLPNIEDPNHLMSSPDDRPRPAGMAPLGLDWPSRLKDLGSFDNTWFMKHWPGLPADFDFGYFNLAPVDQQLKTYFKGRELVQIRGMHPDRHEILINLPGLRCRLFVNRADSAFQEIKTELDTVVLLPHLELGALIWHGMTAVKDDEAEEISHLMAYQESLDEEPKPVDYYQGLLEKPPEEIEAEPPPEPEEDEPETEPEPEAAVSDDEEPAHKPEEDEETARAVIALKDLKQKIIEQEKVLAQLIGGPDEPDLPIRPGFFEAPKFDSPELFLAYMQVMGVSDPKTLETIKKLSAEHLAAADRLKEIKTLVEGTPESLPPEEPREEPEPAPAVPLSLRERVINGHARGESFAGLDLSGVDLSGCKLTGIDLSGADLESANLTETDLEGAHMAGAILTNADLTGANLVAADMAETNLSSAKLSKADLSKADLKLGDLTGADLTGARMSKSDLTASLLEEAVLVGADLTKATAVQALFNRADLTEANLRKADLTTATMDGASLNKANFSKVKAQDLSLAGAKGRRVNFKKADLARARTEEGTELLECDFSGAHLDKVGFEKTDFTKCDFSAVRMEKARLENCTLIEAKFTRAVAPKADLTKSDLTNARLKAVNLMDGNLSKARLSGADFRKANLYGVNLYKSLITKTNFKQANLDRTLLKLGGV